MEIETKHKNFLQFLNNDTILKEEDLSKLLENCCKSLCKQTELYDVGTIFHSNVLELKQLQYALLHTFAKFTRHSQTADELLTFLTEECNIGKQRAQLLSESYSKWRPHIRVQLLNIGNSLPHITDVQWKVEYTVKSNTLDQSGGPVFRVSLKTEQYDRIDRTPKVEFINFTCDLQELQDLVYKLKDAVRHCHRLGAGGN